MSIPMFVAKIPGRTLPRCNHCRASSESGGPLRILVEETEDKPGMRAWVECATCGATQPGTDNATIRARIAELETPLPHVPRLGSAVLVTDGDGVLLGRRGKEPNYGKWVLPGGKIEPFESIDEAAVREVEEETGLAVSIRCRLGVFEIIDSPREHRVIVYSEAEPTGGELRAGDDLLDVRFVKRSELSQLDLTPVVRSVLEAAGWLKPKPISYADASHDQANLGMCEQELREALAEIRSLEAENAALTAIARTQRGELA